MTYADSVKAAGATVDQTIALITKQPVGTVHADAGAVLGGQWDTDIANAVPPPPPPPTALRYGISAGASLAHSVTQVGAHRVRTYTTSQRDQALAIPGLALFHSRKCNQGALAASDPAEVAAVTAEFKPLVGRKNTKVCIDHERNNDQTTLAAVLADAKQYQAAWMVFEQIMATLDPAFTLVPTTTGDVQNHPGGMDPWLVAGVPNIGADIYDPTKFAWFALYAKTHGKQLYVPEYGYHTSPPVTTGKYDAEKNARLVSDDKMMTSAGVVEAYLFNNNQSVIDGCPQSIATMKSLCGKG